MKIKISKELNLKTIRSDFCVVLHVPREMEINGKGEKQITSIRKVLASKINLKISYKVTTKGNGDRTHF